MGALDLGSWNPLPLVSLIVPFLLFPVFGYVALRWLPAWLRMPAFALVNILGTLALAVSRGASGVRRQFALQYLETVTLVFLVYVLLVCVQYLLLKTRLHASISLLYPIAVLIYVKYAPAAWNAGLMGSLGAKPLFDYFIGISYMAFRLSYMVQEIRNGLAPLPGWGEYLSFAFFVPTVSIGPISHYQDFHKSLQSVNREALPLRRCWERIAIGAAKYLFVGNLVNQLSYEGLLGDGWPHPPADLAIAALAYFVYLYLNFSGFCDMAIGVAGLLGIQVNENFNQPFRSRNAQEFWNRWHMSLSSYMRDMVFTPLSKSLIRWLGPRSMTHSIALSIAIVFILMGVWHGTGWRFLLFGVFQATGVVTVHYYTVFLKKTLGKEGYARYEANRIIFVFANALTIAFFAATLFVAANEPGGMAQVLRAVGLMQ